MDLMVTDGGLDIFSFAMPDLLSTLHLFLPFYFPQ